MKPHALLILALLLLPVVSAQILPVHVRPIVGGSTKPNTGFDYNFAFTNNADCSGPVFVINGVSITTDYTGMGYSDLNITGLTQATKYICEYRDAVLRKVHEVGAGFFSEGLFNNEVRTDELCLSGECKTAWPVGSNISTSNGLLGGGTGNVNLSLDGSLVPFKNNSETITGNWVFNGDVIMNSNLYVLGQTGQVNVTEINVNGSIYPFFDGLFDLGGPYNKWNAVYANNLYDKSEVDSLINNISLTPGPQGPPGINGTDGLPGAPGINGTSIYMSSVIDNLDGTYTWVFSDGYNFTTSNIIGPAGANGTNGVDGLNGTNGIDGLNGTSVTISSIDDNLDGTYTWYFSDGYNFTTSNLTGPQGLQGIQGVAGINGTNGIDGLNGTNGIDGINGTNGVNGTNGIDGINGTNGLDGLNGTNGIDGLNGTSVTISSIDDNLDGTYTWYFSDGYNFTTSNLTGPQGLQGIQGVAGINGTNGIDGLNGTNGIDGVNGTSVFISAVVDNLDGTYTWQFSDGYNFTTSNLTGPQGLQGIQGVAGINGLDGLNGTNGIDGLNGTNGVNGTWDGLAANCSVGYYSAYNGTAFVCYLDETAGYIDQVMVAGTGYKSIKSSDIKGDGQIVLVNGSGKVTGINTTFIGGGIDRLDNYYAFYINGTKYYVFPINNNTDANLTATLFGAQTNWTGPNTTADLVLVMNLANNTLSTALGYQTESTGAYSWAAGYQSQALGDHAFAFGYKNIANASNAIAMGSQNTASNLGAIAFGLFNTASGNTAFVLGQNNLASSTYSLATGYNTIASSQASTTFGELTIAAGKNSIAAGYATNTTSYGALVIGRYNVGGGTFNSWVATDPVFEIGIGTSNSAKANALTVYKNGTVNIDSGLLLMNGSQVCSAGGTACNKYNDTALINAVNVTATAALPKTGGTMTGNITMTEGTCITGSTGGYICFNSTTTWIG
jgi:hypothetical protein